MVFVWFLGFGIKFLVIVKFFVLFFEEDVFCFNGVDVCVSIVLMMCCYGIFWYLFMVLFGR